MNKSVVSANLAGIVILAIGLFGVEVTEQLRADVTAALGAAGCLINIGLTYWGARKR